MSTIDLSLLERDNTEGVFSRYEIPRLLLTPIRRRLTGALKLVEGTAVRMIGFSNGSPTVAASSLQEERLGALLVSRGVISAEQLAQIDNAIKTQGLQFGAAATGLGFVTKADLARWLREQHAWVVTRCLLAESQRSTFGPLGKLASARSGLPILRCIESGIREYPPEELANLAQELGAVRFDLPEVSLALARELGPTPSLSQLLEQAGQPRSFQELTVSTDDDDPTVPVLTLVLTRLAVPLDATDAASAQPDRDDRTLPSVRTSTTAEVEIPKVSAAAQARVNEVDDLLSSLRNRPAHQEPPRREAPGRLDPEAGVDDELAKLSRPVPPPSPPEPPRPPPRPTRPPPQPSATDAFLAASGPGRPAPEGALAPSALSSPPADLAELPSSSTAPRPAVNPLAVESEPVSLAGRQTTRPGLTFAADGTPTLPPDSPYAVVRRELLMKLERPRRAGLPVMIAGGAVLLLVGVGIGFGVGRLHLRGLDASPSAPIAMVQSRPTPPAESTPRPTEPAPAPSAEAAPAPATAPATPPAAEKPAAEKPAEKPAEATPAEPERTSTTARHTPKPRTTTRPATEPTEPKPAPPPKPAAEPTRPAGIPAKLSEVRKLLAVNDYRQVVILCTEILKEDGRNAQAYRSLGIAYSGLGAKPQACESYRRYLRLAGDPPDRAQIEAILGACN